MSFEYSTVADILLVAGGTGTLVAALATRAPRGRATSRWHWVAYGLGCTLLFAGLTISALLETQNRPLLRTVAMTLAGLAGVIGTAMVVTTELAVIGGNPAASPPADPVAIWRRGAAVVALVAGDALVVFSLVADSPERRWAGTAGGLLLIVLAAGLLLFPIGLRNEDREVHP